MHNILILRKAMDQLHKAINHCGKYAGYQEDEIFFLPTYKRGKHDDSFYNKKN